MVSGSLSPFCSKCFSPFPHGTGTLSVSHEYLALPDGPGGFTQDSSCPALLRVPLCRRHVRVRGCHPLRRRFPDGFRSVSNVQRRGPTTPPRPEPRRFGLLPVRSPLLGESLSYFLFLRVLRCFSSPRSPLLKEDDWSSTSRVVPFGDPRINGHLRLPAAYRSLSRPSSPVRAKASAMRPYLLSPHLPVSPHEGAPALSILSADRHAS